MRERLPNRDRSAVLAGAIDQAPVCVFVADREMRYVAVNAYACELLGYTEDELLDMCVADVATQAEAPEEYSTLVATAYLRGVSRVRCKDGEELALSYVAGEVEIDGETAYVSVGQIEFSRSG
jgi:two-component system sensor histidine kinase/response regulator